MKAESSGESESGGFGASVEVWRKADNRVIERGRVVPLRQILALTSDIIGLLPSISVTVVQTKIYLTTKNLTTVKTAHIFQLGTS